MKAKQGATTDKYGYSCTRHQITADGIAMLKQLLSVATLLVLLTSTTCLAGERPTFNKTRDPRPDILPYWADHLPPEYRKSYNRPRFWPGWVASKIAPSSQEAMVWSENVRAGSYTVWNAPPRYTRYFAPKPWEVLQTGARPNTKSEKAVPAPAMNSVMQPQPLPAGEAPMPAPLQLEQSRAK